MGHDDRTTLCCIGRMAVAVVALLGVVATVLAWLCQRGTLRWPDFLERRFTRQNNAVEDNFADC